MLLLAVVDGFDGGTQVFQHRVDPNITLGDTAFGLGNDDLRFLGREAPYIAQDCFKFGGELLSNI